MPIHDLYCLACGAERKGTYCPLVTLPEAEYHHGYKVTQAVDFPSCCGAPMGFYPPRVAMDAYEPGTEFQTEVLQPDGTHRHVMVDSLQAIRRLERESEQRQRDGEGQQMVWRDYSQDKGNQHEHSFAKDPAVKPDPAFLKKFRESGGGGASPSAANREYGPGVSDANTSALGGT